MIHEAAAVGFERGADDYVAARPGYPAGVVDLLAADLGLGPGADVLDLAAGTGKLTVDLVARGARVVAVEPVVAMRERLLRDVAGIEVRDGTAEALPLEDASVDLVTVAQAFHWFDAPAALAEIRRVLRPGGGLALIWNVRDETVGWVQGAGRDQGRRRRRSALRPPPGRGLGRPSSAPTAATARTPRTGSPTGRTPRSRPSSAGRPRPVGSRRCPTTAGRPCSTRSGRCWPDHPATRGRERFPFPHATVVGWCRRA